MLKYQSFININLHILIINGVFSEFSGSYWLFSCSFLLSGPVCIVAPLLVGAMHTNFNYCLLKALFLECMIFVAL